MRILGVDPGTQRTGAGVIEVQGSRYHLIHTEVITLRSSETLSARLIQIFRRLCSLISEHRPSVLALENVFYGRDVNAMVKIGEARACAMLAAAEHKISVVEYAPARVKQAVSGNGRATKEQMQAMIKQLLNLRETPPSDGADALAVAICHVHSSHSGNGRKSESSWNSKTILDNFKGRIVAST